jgi:hypothetical protein
MNAVFPCSFTFAALIAFSASVSGGGGARGDADVDAVGSGDFGGVWVAELGESTLVGSGFFEGSTPLVAFAAGACFFAVFFFFVILKDPKQVI